MEVRKGPRLEPLDWLRGVLALSIMAYHFTLWQVVTPDSAMLLGRLGIYAVAMFFVLSGLSMAIVYHRFINDARSAGRFYVRRLFRILPLLWIAIALTPIVPPGLFWLNMTGLFGFVSPGSTFIAGAWSIGNELVYYALTPLLLMGYARSRALGNLLTTGAGVIWALFAFVWLVPTEPLAKQWLTYINPMNNLFLYCAGVATFYNLRDLPSTAGWLIGLASLGVLVFWPVTGDLIGTVTGSTRLAFCAASVGLVICFYRSGMRLPAAIGKPLSLLGLATYGVYLLHPIVLERLGAHFAGEWLVTAAAVVTVAAAVVIYEFIEAPMIQVGKYLTRKVAQPGRIQIDQSSA